MKHFEKIWDRRMPSARLRAWITCIAFGALSACGGGDGDPASASAPATVAAAAGAAPAPARAAQGTAVQRSDPVVQSANPATVRLADRKCVKQARAQAGDGAARKAMRQKARQDACAAAAEAESNG